MDPIIKLDPSGKAPLLSYNIPEPTSYSGKHLVQLEMHANLFKPELQKPPASTHNTPVSDGDVNNFIKDGKMTGGMKGSVGGDLADPFSSQNKMMGFVKSQSNAVLLGEQLKSGKKVVFSTTMGGETRARVIDKPKVAKPCIFIVEHVALSSFLGNYGAGRTLSTFTLLPGEKTTISMKTYKRSTETRQEASSILDSYTDEKATEFEDAVQSESSHSESKDTSFNYYADVEGSGNWGVAKVSAKAGVSGSVNSAREDFSKNVSSATRKESSKASAKRDVEINTSSESTSESGEESSIERTLENINVSATLNFVFRQMNQEFINILHLTDVRVGFFNGFDESKREVPLYDLDSLLSEVCADAAAVVKVREAVHKIILGTKDWKGARANDLFLKNNEEGAEWYTVNKDKVTTYEDPATHSQVSVRGIILDVSRNVMRTDGVIVEALLGQGPALDDYSQSLQAEKVREKQLTNALLQMEVNERQKRLEILSAGDANKADVYAKVFPAQNHATELNGNSGS